MSRRPFDLLLAELDLATLGEAMHGLVRELYPIARSITGNGVRQTLARMRQLVEGGAPLEVHEVASGTEVFDWRVPPEWSVREAWVEDAQGHRVVDFSKHNLHLVGYSAPVEVTLPLAELQEHLHSLPDQPDVIPYRTSDYKETWGFCLPHRVREALPEGEYRVKVDSTLDPAGSLTYGELLLEGETDREVLISSHICHPSLANDNLSGVVMSLFLARALAAQIAAGHRPRHSYRFLWIPGTIGSITWLATHREAATRIDHGLVTANLGDPGDFHYKRSRQGDATIDRAAAVALATRAHAIEDFVPFGYDERQYCSPGFDLAVGSLTRTPYGQYPEYHTSADDLDFVQAACLAESLQLYAEVCAILDGNAVCQNLHPHCEPQLGRRGLYRMLGGDDSGRDRELALLWVLNLSDGSHDLLAIAERSGLPFPAIRAAADALLATDLLRESEDPEP